jgi:fructose 1,6-bisphosphatase
MHRRKKGTDLSVPTQVIMGTPCGQPAVRRVRRAASSQPHLHPGGMRGQPDGPVLPGSGRADRGQRVHKGALPVGTAQPRAPGWQCQARSS